MSPDGSAQKGVVKRISVDEKLADDLIRLLVCSLADGIQEFSDQKNEWGPESAVMVGPATYAAAMGLASQKQCSWKDLSEGQVFLSGEFEITGSRSSPHHFRVNPGRHEFLRIDNLETFKNRTRLLYSQLLTRRT